MEPEAKAIFGFKDDLTMAELTKHERFSKHATYFIQMIDKALGMLGPDIELLTEILMDLGMKHAKVNIVVISTRYQDKNFGASQPMTFSLYICSNFL